MICPHCDGKGGEPGAEHKPCHVCDGADFWCD